MGSPGMTHVKLHSDRDPELPPLQNPALPFRRNQISPGRGRVALGKRCLRFSGLNNEQGEHSPCTKRCNNSFVYNNSLEPHNFLLREIMKVSLLRTGKQVQKGW